MSDTVTPETWVFGYAMVDQSKITDQKPGEFIPTDYLCAYFASFNEAKSACLAVISEVGMDMLQASKLGNKYAHRVVHKLFEAGRELMPMTEDDMPKSEDMHVGFDAENYILLFLQKGEVKESDNPLITFTVIADHRKCTPDFCFTGQATNLN